ncbi:Penicillin binding protein transpeptidase domain-containing protein [Thermomonospora echinospora]|uniref:Penicillin binding protein transpeptidase domain-containing protein n=1 Tax=Thermomonospora echinospora TaxID=1992 RepID=A0A1H5ZYG7_9ACTN|nr:penicillin-binding transpeptidase domain-containing protein [Thermomonospora echinospora]SEG40737.1 Penicillin binding protein transpeptidase domain-containing protein [Thermomonospora echinospora]
MRSRGVLVLAGMLAVVLAAGAVTAFSMSRKVRGSPEQASRDYFAAWRDGGLERMSRLVADPPGDFAVQHRALSNGLKVYSVELEPGPLVRDPGGESAYQEFEVTRNLAGRVTWTYRSTLRMGLVDRRWKVLWSPATLHPDLRGPATWKLAETESAPATFLARDKRPLPGDGTLQPYIAALAERFGDSGDSGDSGDDTRGWAVELIQPGAGPRRLAVLGAESPERIRTTLDRTLQSAAEKAVSGKTAAIVAVRPSTGEILAVADRLGGRNAFLGNYPPGSTFKVVTAAALLSDGMSSSGGVDCPGSVVTAQRTIRNSEGLALGGTSLREAFAHSCNTTFARLAVERLRAAKLAEAAGTFGFGGPIAPGIAAVRGSFPEPGNGAELAEAAIGQGRVQASPLVMAMVAAAVADGTWRSPRLVDAKLIRGTGDRPQPSHDVPNAAALRTMMRAVVTDGTAERAGLPSGTAGKTGTAEVGGGEPHAWFVGYRDDLAFAAFVAGGGSGPEVAAPLAARFLRAR